MIVTPFEKFLIRYTARFKQRSRETMADLSANCCTQHILQVFNCVDHDFI